MKNRLKVHFFSARLKKHDISHTSSRWPEEYAIKNDLSRIWGSLRALFTLQRAPVS